MQIAQSVERRRSLRSGLRRLSLVRGNVDHLGLIKEFNGLRSVMAQHGFELVPVLPGLTPDAPFRRGLLRPVRSGERVARHMVLPETTNGFA